MGSEQGGASGPPDRRGVRHWLAWQAVTAASVLALVLLACLRSSRFFFAGDKQNQYLPVARDIGRRLRAGEWLPVIDPDLGRSGNYAIDLQYGLYEPTHWLTAIALSSVQNLTLAATLWAAAYLVLLACGGCALLLRLGVAGGWAAATALGIASSGYVFFWAAPSWIPALVTLAWVPWWWCSVVGSRLRTTGLVASGILAFLICGGGWPATGLLWGFLAIGLLVEAWARRAEPGVLRSAMLHLLASAGGAFAALITFLPVQRSVDFTSRQTTVENSGFLIPNLADILGFASPELHGDMAVFGRVYPAQAPLFFGVWFVAVVVWLVPWRRDVLLRPAFVTSGVGLVLTLLLTQAPSHLGALRWPIRLLPGVPLFLGVGVAVAVAALGLRMSRGRATGAVLSILAVTVLAYFRDPERLNWLILGVITLSAAAALLVGVGLRRARLAGVAALLTTMVLAGWAIGRQSDTGMADRGTPSRLEAGALSPEQRPVLVLYPEGSAFTWRGEGVAPGFLLLSESHRTQPGYSSLGQRGWDRVFCVRSAHSYACPDAAARLHETEPRTQETWVDLLDYQEVVVHQGPHLTKWVAATRGSDEWVETGRSKHFVRFSRTEPDDVQGRVTAVMGDATVETVEVARDRQVYRIASEEGGTIVFRDLFWPGYVATLDGERLTARPLDRTLVTVEVPPGSSGTLTLTFEPMPLSWLAVLVGGGMALVGLAVLLARREPRTVARGGRRDSASPGS